MSTSSLSAGLLLVFLSSVWPVMRVAASYQAQGTFYNVGADLGACGQMHYNNEYVVALAKGIFDTYPGADPSNPNNNPICNKTLLATYKGKGVVVQVVDRCAGCEEEYNTDFSPTAFKVLAPESVGRLYDVEWDWTDLPQGPHTPDNSSSTDDSSSERRSKILGRRKTLDIAPSRSFKRDLSRSSSGKAAQLPKRRHLTQAERRGQSGKITSLDGRSNEDPHSETNVARDIPVPHRAQARGEQRRRLSTTESES
ncbi:hypothetical protein H0H92_004574 [Tricholoma furcatifolium]|nr:hypothetical protein H0H92_004574 [Tricholoma furcatifolium]